MIQQAMPGEVLVGVPPVGSLLDLHLQLDPIFGGALLRGRRASGDNAVEWMMDGHETVEAGHAAADAARRSLRERCREALELAETLREALSRASRDAATVDLPADAVRRLGGRPSGERSTVPVGQVRALRDALPKAVAAVERAVLRGNFAVRGGHAKLFGWCFLTPDSAPGGDLPARPVLQLRHTVEAAGLPAERHRLDWTVSGRGEQVWLARCDAGAHDVVEGTDRMLPGTQDAGFWRFEPGRLRGGGTYRAVVRWWGGLAESNPIVMPPEPEAPAAVPETSLAPSPEVPPVRVRLDLRDPRPGEVAPNRLEWSVDQDVETVELWRVDQDPPTRVAGPDQVTGAQRSGGWAFGAAELPHGSEYEARAWVGEQSSVSNRVRIPVPPPPEPPQGGGWCRGLWRWWALWGPCAWCARLGWRCCPGLLWTLLRVLIAAGALFLLACLLHGCFPEVPGLGWLPFGESRSGEIVDGNPRPVKPGSLGGGGPRPSKPADPGTPSPPSPPVGTPVQPDPGKTPPPSSPTPSNGNRWKP